MRVLLSGKPGAVHYLKSRYMLQNDPELGVQKLFDEKVIGLNAFDFSNEGPEFRKFASKLMQAGIIIP